jgi:hypothetical protein
MWLSGHLQIHHRPLLAIRPNGLELVSNSLENLYSLLERGNTSLAMWQQQWTTIHEELWPSSTPLYLNVFPHAEIMLSIHSKIHLQLVVTLNSFFHLDIKSVEQNCIHAINQPDALNSTSDWSLS